MGRTDRKAAQDPFLEYLERRDEESLARFFTAYVGSVSRLARRRPPGERELDGWLGWRCATADEPSCEVAA